MAKTTISPAISTAKNPASASRKKYNASTRGAIVDAESGKSLSPAAPISVNVPCVP